MAISKLPTSASLKQVMDKFEEISFQDFSSIQKNLCPNIHWEIPSLSFCHLQKSMPTFE